MGEKNKLGLQFDPDGEKMTSEQLSESYQSGVIEEFDPPKQSDKKGSRQERMK
ncbi:hypothetical protein ACFFGV_01830 [Pontibacillus salicampi]|uniref:DUF4025 domain-containing protein n=1 Tax=Pontibacillus salicampi TaxID=1449801 RepID=A0ABV6LJ48_9BACI